MIIKSVYRERALMRSIREYLTSDRQGFAISFEIMMTMIMVTLVCSVTAYFAQVFEMERYFADVKIWWQ